MKARSLGTCLVVLWLRLQAPNTEGLSLIPGQATRFHMLQLRVHIPQLKILSATTKTWCSQIYTYIHIYTYMYIQKKVCWKVLTTGRQRTPENQVFLGSVFIEVALIYRASHMVKW